MMQTRRNFIFAAASTLLLAHLPTEAQGNPTPNEAWLEWILERLTPGVLIGITGDAFKGIQELIAEVMRNRGDKLIYVNDAVHQPAEMKRECLRLELPMIARMGAGASRNADILLHLDGDTLTLVKHRWGSLTGPEV